MHGGVKFYRGAAKAARAYVGADRSRADDYYLTEGSGLAEHLIATSDGVEHAGSMDGDTYEQWVAGYDITPGPHLGQAKGQLCTDEHGLRFVEVTVNGPKTWSIAAALHPEISTALDAAQDKAAVEIVGWLTEHATTRVGPKGRQVQLPVERLEAALIRHYTSRAGDPHRHLHLQINARVYATGGWRGLHSVGVRDSIEAINGIGHAAVATDPEFRRVLAAYGFTLDPETSEIRDLAPYVGAFSARGRQIHRNIDRYDAEWRSENPGQEPGPRLRESWDRRAWADARPDKVIPTDGRELVARWNDELHELGYTDPTGPTRWERTLPGRIDRDAADLVITQLGAKRSAWNGADIRGHAETLLAQTALIADTAARAELAEDITARAKALCLPLLARRDVPEHIRSWTSREVLAVEDEIIHRLAERGTQTARKARVPARRAQIGRGIVRTVANTRIDPSQLDVVETLAGDARLVVVEGAAGAGKTTVLRAVQTMLARQGHRLVVVTPTLKAAQVAAAETGAEGHSAAWLIHRHGWRWDSDGHWNRHPQPAPPTQLNEAQLEPEDLLLVDEAGMLDQDTARALLTVADETGARVALVGDRHQLPAVGRGGVLDHATTWAHPSAVVGLGGVHRFTDPDYATLSLKMRLAENPGAVFDQLHARGQIAIHNAASTRLMALAKAGARGELVIADTHEAVADLNATIHDELREHHDERPNDIGGLVTATGEVIATGARVATRRNNADLGVANRQTWTVRHISADGSLVLQDAHDASLSGRREIPAAYARQHVELAYATTAYGAQGETVQCAHAAIDPATTAAAAYVALTRGRETNTAHLVALDIDEARAQWIDVFSHDRADLGPAHARHRAIEDIDRYGPTAPPPARSTATRPTRPVEPRLTQHLDEPTYPRHGPSPGYGVAR